MSEQTPDTESGMAEGQDPSMEDILASIRKIIAEDDVQAPTPPETVIADIVPDTQSLGGDVSQLGQLETLDLDIITDEAPEIDADIEALIGDNDAAASDNIALSIAPLENNASESLEDILDLEIPMDETEVLSEIETAEPEALIDLAETETLTLEDELIDLVEEPESIDLVADLDAPDADIPAADIEENSNAGLVGGALAAMGLGGAAAMSKAGADEADASDGDDLSLMLDNMLEDTSSYDEAPSELSEDRVTDPAAELISEDVSDDDILSEIDFVQDTDSAEVISKSDPDIDLVKSLMADLTEEPLHEEPVLEESVLEESVLEEPVLEESVLEEAEGESVALDDSEEPDTTADDIMDEILSITIDDETKLSEEIAPADVDALALEGLVEEIAQEEIAAEVMSLKDIAAAAEADAKASETVISTGAAAGLAAAAVAGVAAVTTQETPEPVETPIETAPDGNDDELDDIDTALSQLDNLLATENEAEEETLTPETPIEETPDMARAKKTDAIIDEVTETASAGAFASLNQVVEEKAVVAERGDRIGDLVQEALRPMLKEWLDKNLKGIVERAVTKEVKRISSGK